MPLVLIYTLKTSGYIIFHKKYCFTHVTRFFKVKIFSLTKENTVLKQKNQISMKTNKPMGKQLQQHPAAVEKLQINGMGWTMVNIYCICCKIFKVCLTILGHYALKG